MAWRRWGRWGGGGGEGGGGGGGGGGGVGGGGGEGGGGLGTHWKPLNTPKTLARAARVVGWGGGVEAVVRAVGAEGVWAHIGSGGGRGR